MEDLPVGSRDEWLWRIGQQVGARITSVPRLRKWLKANDRPIPIRCGGLRDLEAIAHLLGVPDAREGFLEYKENKPEKVRVGAKPKTKIPYVQIQQLRVEGKTFREIGAIAGLSATRIQQICASADTDCHPKKESPQQ